MPISTSALQALREFILARRVAAASAPEQKLMQGFYRGYAGDYDALKAAEQGSGVFVSPQREVAEYYARKRAEQTSLPEHIEMVLADPFAGYAYGHSTRGTGKNLPLITRARELAPEDVVGRTVLKARGGLAKLKECSCGRTPTGMEFRP